MTRLEPVTVTATTPLTVTLASGATGIKAVPIAGLTYSTTGKYIALLQEGAMPVVFPTA